MKEWWFPALVVAVLVGWIAFEVGDSHGYKRCINEPHKADTVWRDTTIYIDKPVEVVKWKDREKPVYIALTDTVEVSIHDTTYIAMEREFRQYSGENYEAQVSGVQPNLDWIKINQQTAYITNTVVQKKRWSWSLTAGPGIFWDGKEVKPGAGLVIGGSFNF
jgi:hypothetical protein